MWRFCCGLNLLQAIERLPFFRATPPARVWISMRRLDACTSTSGPVTGRARISAHAWFVWDAGAERTGQLGWFDWKELAPDGPELDR